MKQTKKQTQIHFRMDAKDVTKIDRTAKRYGYSSRSEFLSSLALAAARGAEPAEKTYKKPIPETAKTWIGDHTWNVSEEEIRKTLTETIDELTFAAIAVRGASLICDSAWTDIRAAVREKTGVWLAEDEIRNAIEEFEKLNRPRILEYRAQILEGGEV